MSDFIKLKNIADRNGDIVSFNLSSNLKSAKTGKDGWGEVVIAVDNKTITEMAVRDKYIGVLYLVSKEDWEKETKNNE